MPNNRTLVLMKSYIGDAVMAAPLIRALSAEAGGIVLASSGPVDEILKWPDRSVAKYELVRTKSLRSILALARDFRSQGFTRAILVNHSFRSALVARLAGIRVRVGHSTEHRGFLLTHKVGYDRERFESRSTGDLALPLGLTISQWHPNLYVSPFEQTEGIEMLDGATIGIQAGARYPTKQIPGSLLVELVDTLQAQGHSVALLGGPDEIETATALENALSKPVLNLVGGTTIRESVGILANLRLFIAADTGLMHLSAGIGCPTVAAFGPTNAKKWGHNYAPHRVVQAPNGDMNQLCLASILQSVDSLVRLT